VRWASVLLSKIASPVYSAQVFSSWGTNILNDDVASSQLQLLVPRFSCCTFGDEPIFCENESCRQLSECAADLNSTSYEGIVNLNILDFFAERLDQPLTAWPDKLWSHKSIWLQGSGFQASPQFEIFGWLWPRRSRGCGLRRGKWRFIFQYLES